jgi:thioesterase domain-containing protein
VDGVVQPHETIEEMAEAYLVELRSVQKEGPYVLAGYSAGGVVAFEMAHRLVAAGESVRAVVLFETDPGPPEPESPGAKAARHVRRTVDEGVEYLGGWLKTRAAWEAWRVKQRVVELMTRDRGKAMPLELRDRAMNEAFSAARKGHRLEPLEVPLVLFFSVATPEPDRVAIERTWRSLGFAGVDVHVVSGEHGDMILEPHVKEIADVLEGLLVPAPKPGRPHSQGSAEV